MYRRIKVFKNMRKNPKLIPRQLILSMGQYSCDVDRSDSRIFFYLHCFNATFVLSNLSDETIAEVIDGFVVMNTIYNEIRAGAIFKEIINNPGHIVWEVKSEYF